MIGIEQISQDVGKYLIDNNISIAIAESCTGGLISSKITDVSGISKVFRKAFITYSNESKIEDLGVKEETINSFGAVSKETAVEMAKNIRLLSKTDIGISVTGIAGPSGASDIKPVGLVYIGISDNYNTSYKEFKFQGNRQEIRNYAALEVFKLLLTYQKK